MKKRSLISIIVCFTKNDKNLLENCLTAIEKSAVFAGLRTEYILTANGTKPPLFAKFKKKVKIIKNRKNQGLAKSVNIAIKKAKGDWCLFTCPDVTTSKLALKLIYSGIRIKNLGLIAPKVRLLDSTIQP